MKASEHTAAEHGTHHRTSHHENGAEKMSNEVDTLKENFSQLRTDVMELLGSAFGIGKAGAQVAKDGASNAVESMKDRLESLRERGADSVATLEQKIEDKPLQAALIAFGVGFVVAKILSRR